MMDDSREFVSILMLTYNAPGFVLQSIVGVRKFKKASIHYELIVLDNRSKLITRCLVRTLKWIGLIDKLIMNNNNDLFARGNNLASQQVSEKSTHYLLLNSDIKVIRNDCLEKLLELHPKCGGVTSFGAVLSEPLRADGYCMMIDKYLYDLHKLDERFEWWWSVTKLESEVLSQGKIIRAVRNHEKYLHHYGGMSGKGFLNAKGMDIKIDDVKKWFDNSLGQVEIIDEIG